VVDESGRPLLVYHGAGGGDFNVFDRAMSGKGPSKLGFWFTGDAEFAGNFGSAIMPAYLSIQNPKLISKREWDSIREEHGGDAAWFAGMREGLVKQGFDGIIIKGGMEQVGRFEVRNPDVFAVFESRQAKSLFNKGAFGVRDDRIDYSTGAEPAGGATPAKSGDVEKVPFDELVKSARDWFTGPFLKWFTKKIVDDKEAMRRMQHATDEINAATRRVAVMTKFHPDSALLAQGVEDVAEALRDFLYEFRKSGLRKEVRAKLEGLLKRMDELTEEVRGRPPGEPGSARYDAAVREAARLAEELEAMTPRPPPAAVTTAGLEDVTARLRGSAEGVVAAMLESGMVDFSGRRVGPALSEATAGLGAEGVKAFNRYLKAKRALAVFLKTQTSRTAPFAASSDRPARARSSPRRSAPRAAPRTGRGARARPAPPPRRAHRRFAGAAGSWRSA
jgi:hypothetical protein